VLPTVDAPGAVCVAERIRSAFEAEPIVIERDKVAITVSLGIAVSGGTSSFDAESLLHYGGRGALSREANGPQSR
jgi:PleD family two-component response regulator